MFFEPKPEPTTQDLLILAEGDVKYGQKLVSRDTAGDDDMLPEHVKRLPIPQNPTKADIEFLRFLLKEDITDDSLQANVRSYINRGQLGLARYIAQYIEHPQLRQSMALYCDNARKQ